jgi:hypothetical protein
MFRPILCVALSALVAVSMAKGIIVVGPQNQLKEMVFYRGSGNTEGSGDVEVVSTIDLGTLPAGGRVIGAHDFDGNGFADLVLEYDPDGAGPKEPGTFLWRFGVSGRSGVTQLGGVAGGYTVPVGVTDLDHDGNFEVVMQNASNLNLKVTEISKSAPYVAGTRTIVAGGKDRFTSVVGIADWNGDGSEDLVLQDPVTKELRYRYLNGFNSNRQSDVLHNWAYTPPNGKVFGALNAFYNDNVPYFLVESPDGVKPRKGYEMLDTANVFETTITGDDAYRSWPAVAVVN